MDELRAFLLAHDGDDWNVEFVRLHSARWEVSIMSHAHDGSYSWGVADSIDEAARVAVQNLWDSNEA